MPAPPGNARRLECRKYQSGITSSLLGNIWTEPRNRKQLHGKIGWPSSWTSVPQDADIDEKEKGVNLLMEEMGRQDHIIGLLKAASQ